MFFFSPPKKRDTFQSILTERFPTYVLLRFFFGTLQILEIVVMSQSNLLNYLSFSMKDQMASLSPLITHYTHTYHWINLTDTVLLLR